MKLISRENSMKSLISFRALIKYSAGSGKLNKSEEETFMVIRSRMYSRRKID